MGTVMLGTEVAKAMKERLIQRAEAMKEKGVMPKLAILRVGARPDDLSYERGAKKRMELTGMASQVVELPEDVSQKKLEETLEALSQKLPLFIVSNCNAEYIPCFLDAHQLHRYFQDWECIGRTGKQKWENIRLVVERNHLQRPVYVGDTTMDQEAAQKAGVPFLHAAYGFGEVTGAPEISQFPQLLELLQD